ncbi:MFS transporter [Parasphingopyxis sp.]|uniref:MFS transporter n=1 Tax=Parasphingopyxis sp. TaxID=1920299 RepID=UPI002631677F|nr:MFS transporter [Parasphingopyxis sp.]
MSDQKTIDVETLINRNKIGGFQKRVIGLCILIAVLEGFDLQVIAFTAPQIMAEWSVSQTAFAAVFAAGLVGLMIGSVVLGALGDRYGRKWPLIISFAAAGAFCLATAFSENVFELMIFRFLTGLGLGGSIPNAIALVSEYSPSRHRGTMVALVAGGFPLGGAVGGLVVAPIIADLGWQTVFVVGGLAPLMVAVLIIFILPESIQYLATRPNMKAKLDRLLKKVDRDYAPSTSAELAISIDKPSEPEADRSMRSLFTEGRARGTLLLWGIFFTNLLMLYLLINWLPSLLTQAGFGIEAAIFSVAAFNCGGILASVALGRALDRMSPYPWMIGTYVFAAAMVLYLGVMGANAATLYLLMFLTGAGVAGPQLAMNALAAAFYPTRIRSSGLGAALGVGRIGAILGPLLGGVVMTVGFSGTSIFTLLALPASICAGFVWVLWRQVRRQT